MNSDEWIAAGLIAAGIVLIGVVVYSSHQEEQRWQAFAATHDCKVTGKMSSSSTSTVGVGLLPDGQIGTVVGLSTTPAKTAYTCDDGVTYWR